MKTASNESYAEAQRFQDEREAKAYETLKTLLPELAAQLPLGPWILTESQHNGPRTSSNWFYLSNGKLKITAKQLWNNCERVEFSASEWPSYEDTDGKDRRMSPYDVGWKSQTTTAAIDREPRLIARQVKSKLLEWYVDAYGKLATRAKERAGNTADWETCRAKLADATGDHSNNGYGSERYYNDKATGIHCKMRSPSSVVFDVGVDEAVKIINLLRTMRTAGEP